MPPFYTLIWIGLDLIPLADNVSLSFEVCHPNYSIIFIMINNAIETLFLHCYTWQVLPVFLRGILKFQSNFQPLI